MGKNIDYAGFTMPSVAPIGTEKDLGTIDAVGREGKLQFQAICDFASTLEDVYLIPLFSLDGENFIPIDDNGSDYKVQLTGDSAGGVVTDLMPGTRFKFILEFGSMVEGDEVTIKIST